VAAGNCHSGKALARSPGISQVRFADVGSTMTRDKEAKTAAEQRRQRLADELRANLLRRKSRERARSEGAGSSAEPEKKAKTGEA